MYEKDKWRQEDEHYRNYLNTRYYNRQEEVDRGKYHDRNEDYLRFLKLKNTPPPRDLQPKKLRYENFYNNNYFDNYNFNRKRLNILTPTPFKDEQVVAGAQNLLQAYQHNTTRFDNNNLNNSQLLKETTKPHQQNYGFKKNYVSKYPVQISHKKNSFYPNKEFSRQQNFNNFFNQQQNKFIYPQTNTNNFFRPIDQREENMNQVSYKVINAEDYMKTENPNEYSQKYFSFNLAKVKFSLCRLLVSISTLNQKTS